MNFIIADDNKKMRSMIRRLLEDDVRDIGEITECANGAEAVHSYDRCRPDWVLMDIRMEKMDGMNAAREIIGKHPYAKIIIVTQYDDDMLSNEARKIGVRACVLKENLWIIPAIVNDDIQY